MDDLIAFLRARYDDDEAAALAASEENQPPWRSEVGPDANGYNEGRIVDAENFPMVHVEDQTPEPATAMHIARWDPARALAEVEAKRRILDLHRPHTTRYVKPQCHECSGCGCCSVGSPCDTVKLLALPHVGHPDYREEWRP